MSGASTSNPIFDSLAFLLEPDMAVLIAILLLLLAFMSFSGRKGKLAQARWAGTTEKLAALNIAMKQLKKRKHNQVCLYLGTPKGRISLHKIPLSLPWTLDKEKTYLRNIYANAIGDNISSVSALFKAEKWLCQSVIE